ncbi:MAG: transcriptional regulator [Akkermansiaceae bacterium]|nr:transcriptional regulator [Akkermansiaceae bacterium]
MVRVKQLREASGLTQEKFAERAGLDYKYYQHIEAGRKPNLGMETLLKLAKGTGRELWELLNFDSAPQLALGEDRPKNESAAASGKGARKATRHKAGGKEA